MLPRTGQFGIGFMWLLACGCGESESGAPGSGRASEFDSGQEAAQPTLPPSDPSADTVWQVEPELQLGLSEGPEAHLFFQIRGATRLSTGEVVVLHGGAGELRAFSSDGIHLWTAGGRGDGPGEMRAPSHLERLPGDLIQVQDGLSRIRYRADGALVAHERLAMGRLTSLGRYFVSECPVPGFVGDHIT